MASPNERLLYAAKSDAADMVQDLLAGGDGLDVNFQDGLGMTVIGRQADMVSLTKCNQLYTTRKFKLIDLRPLANLTLVTRTYRAATPSPSVLELLLDYEHTDVDLQNRLDGATPLHLAVKLDNEDARQGVIEMLLDAGADPAIKDKHGCKVADYLNTDTSETDRAIAAAISAAIAEAAFGGVDAADIADDNDDGGAGTGSDSD
ncbi:hypothetical protein OIV83_005356 [Microbotryomycetes sp. JL201]|nr:hypothetical protein OIV83_005356 [Microbotryomycetes sp. JL201]